MDQHERELWERLRAVEVLVDQQRCLWNEREKRLNERWESQERALVMRTTELEQRLELLNELRGNVVNRDEYEAKHQSLVLQTARNYEAIVELRKDVAVGSPSSHELEAVVQRSVGEKAGIAEFWNRGLSILALLVSLGVLIALLLPA